MRIYRSLPHTQFNSGRQLPPALVAILAAALGLLDGWFNGTAIAAVTFVLVALVAAFIVALRKPWMRIAVRVAGSWVAATGLLMLGWSLSGRG